MHVYDTLKQAIHAREAYAWFYEVKAHIGIEGNKIVDRGAKFAAAAYSDVGMANVDCKPRPQVWRFYICVYGNIHPTLRWQSSRSTTPRQRLKDTCHCDDAKKQPLPSQDL